MPLTLDPEYVKAIEPYMPVLANAPQLPIGDIKSRREGSTALFDMIMPAWPVITDVEHTQVTVKADDGYQIPFHRFVKAGTSSASPGSAIFYAHGGGYFGLSVEQYTGLLEACWRLICPHL